MDVAQQLVLIFIHECYSKNYVTLELLHMNIIKVNTDPGFLLNIEY